MSTKNTSLGKRVLALVLSLVMVLGMFPPITVAAEEPDEGSEASKIGAVAILNSDGTINPNGAITPEGTDGTHVKVTPAATTYEWVPMESIRPKDGWWAGIRVDAPDFYEDSEEMLANAQFKLNDAKEYSNFLESSEKQGKDLYLSLWKSLNPLMDNEPVEDTLLELDWDGDGVCDQSVVLHIDPANVVLTRDGAPVYEPVTLKLKVNGQGVVKLGSRSYDADAAITVGKNLALNLQAEGIGSSKVREVKLDGVVVDALPASVDQDAELEVTFHASYTVSYDTNNASGGTVSLSAQEVWAGESVQVDVEAAENYEIESIRLNDAVQELTGPKSFSLEMIPEANTHVEVNFVYVCTVNLTIHGDGQVLVDNKPTEDNQVVIKTEGQQVTLVATPDENHRVADFRVNGVTIPGFVSKNSESVTHTLSLNKEYAVEVTFAPNQYAVQATVGANGSISGLGTMVNHGENLTFQVHPEEGYEALVMVGETVLSPNEQGEYVWENVTGPVAISVTFSLKTYKISVAEGYEDWIKLSSGDSAPVLILTAEHFDEINLIVTDMDTYQVTEIQVGEQTFPAGTGKFTATGNAEVSVSFGLLAPYNGPIEIRGAVVRQNDIYYISKGSQSEVAVEAGDAPIRLVKANEKVTIIKWWEYAEVRGGADTTSLTVAEMQTAIEASADELNLPGELGKDGYLLQVKGENGWQNVGLPIRFVVDDTAPEVKLAKLEKTYHSEDFTVAVKCSVDKESGLEALEYAITTQADAALISEWNPVENQTIPVVAKDHDMENVLIWVRATDKTGNVSYDSVTVHINTEAPMVKSVVIPDDCSNQEGETVTITLTDRYYTFNPDGLVLVDENGQKISTKYTLEWEEDQLVAYVTFEEEGTHNWFVSYTNLAGMQAESGPHTLTLDRTKPEGSLVLKEQEKTWAEEITDLIFSLFGKTKNENGEALTYTFEASWVEEGSGMESQTYYVDHVDLDGTIRTFSYLEALYAENPDAFTTEQTVVLSEPSRCVVYARGEDKAGNVAYCSTEGIILEDGKPHVELSYSSKIDFIPGRFTEDFKVHVNALDVLSVQDIYSGIHSASYKIIGSKNGEVLKEESDSLELEDLVIRETQTGAALASEANGYTGVITVKASDYDDMDIQVQVTVRDFAGNETTVTEELEISTQKPEVGLEVTGVKKDEAKDGYYAGDVSAAITFDGADRTFTTQNAESAVKVTKDDVAFEVTPAWNDKEMTLTFTEDGAYTVSVDYTNTFGSAAEHADISFVIDTEAPKVEAKLEGKSPLDQVLAFLTFGILGDEEVPIKATVETKDVNPVRIGYYVDYKYTGAEARTEEFMEELTYDPFCEDEKAELDETKEFADESHFVVYFKAVDYAGNVTYVCSNGAIVDKSAPAVSWETTKTASGIYTDEAEVKIYVSDVSVHEGIADDVYSGIRRVWYQIEMDGAMGDEYELYRFDEEQPFFSRLQCYFDDAITVKAEDYNRCEIKVHVFAEDNAGHVTENIISLDMDATAPEVNVDYDCAEPVQNEIYYPAQRVATVTITERTHHFDPANVRFTFTAKNHAGGSLISKDEIHLNGNGYEVDEDGDVISDGPSDFLELVQLEWQQDELNLQNPDKDKHIVKLTFSADAEYTFDVSFADKAGRQANDVAKEHFVVDKTAPTGSITAQGFFKLESGSEWTDWSNTQNGVVSEGDFCFGLWANHGITVTAQHGDETSGIQTVEYAKVSDYEWMNPETIEHWENHENLNEDVIYRVFGDDERFTIYLRLTDFAGNVTYLSTNGLILDDEKPETVNDVPRPEIVFSSTEEIYKGDVPITITVTEPKVGSDQVYSGLKEIYYEVKSLGKTTLTEKLYTFDVQNPGEDDLEDHIEREIVILAAENNSNDVVVTVTAVDNAGNMTSEDVKLQIDATKPKIDVSYNSIPADSGTFYRQVREATITITERNFDPSLVKVTITNTDGVIPVHSDWVKHEGSGNGDDTTYTAKIGYSADGDYTFDITCQDKAGHQADGWNSSSPNAKEFTIDRTNPVIQVSYDNNAVANGRYFKAGRTATVTITEHNFDQNRVVFTRGTDRGGQLPNIAWSHSGDRHTATIRYTADGDYTFDVTMTDKAGNTSGAANYGNSAAGKDFVIDTTFEDMITYEGVEHGAGYGYDVTLIPSIRISDINLANTTVTLKGIQMNKTIDLTEEVNALLQKGSETVTGIFDIFKQTQDLDGIYTLSILGEDKAGNQDQEEVIFTVNRFGSVYVYEDYLMSLIADGGAYVQSVTEDLVIHEYNADKLLANSLKLEITCDGRPVANVDYDVTPEINDTVTPGSSGWYQYRYTISKDNFASDGLYRITVASKDQTGNTPENNNYKGMEIAFRVDSTKPEITSIVGLEDSIFDEPTVDVTFTVFDAIGLKSVKVYINGDLDQEITDFSNDNSNYSGSFQLKEDDNLSSQKVRLVVEDLAGNVTDTDDASFAPVYPFHSSVTISTNIFVLWFANKPLFYGSIAGFSLLVFLFALLTKKRKKEEK